METKRERKSNNVTIIDVAQEAGVSYSTVSRVLSGYEFVKDSTRERVLKAAKRLGYVVNIQARSLAGGRSNMIGLLVPGLDNGYIGEIARGIDVELANTDYDLLLYTTHRSGGKESEFVSRLSRGLADGLLLIIPILSSHYLSTLREQNFPYVLIDQTDPDERSCVIDSTNWQGAYDATQYLIELGHTRIGFITGQTHLSSTGDRLEGYKAALKDHGIPYPSAWIEAGDYLIQSGYEATQRLLALPESPSAIFASNDLMAFGVMDAVRQQGLEIGRDISVMGFDDIPQSQLVYPLLTTVRQELDTMGRTAVQMLIEHITNPDAPAQHVALPTKLIIRDSCYPPR